MSVFLSPVGGAGAQFFDNNGVPLTGGKLYTYAAGTTTPAATYTSVTGATAHANPIVLDAAGRVSGSSEIWLSKGVIYKFVLKDSNDVLIGTYDNVPGVNDVDATNVSYTPAITSLLDGVVTTVQEALDELSDEENGSSFVGFIQSGANAVKRNVQQELRQVFYVSQFGALTNGTDATAAVNNTILAAYKSKANVASPTDETFNVEVRFESGKDYTISGTILLPSGITLNGNGCRLVGGQGSAMTAAYDPSLPALIETAYYDGSAIVTNKNSSLATNRVVNSGIVNFKFINTNCAINAVSMNEQCFIEHNMFNNVSAAMRLKWCFYLRVVQNTLRQSSQAAGQSAIHLIGGNHNAMLFQQNALVAPAIGILVNGPASFATVIDSCTFEEGKSSNSAGILFGSDAYCGGWQINNNYVEGVRYGFSFDDGASVYGGVIDANIFNNNEYAIICSGPNALRMTSIRGNSLPDDGGTNRNLVEVSDGNIDVVLQIPSKAGKTSTGTSAFINNFTMGFAGTVEATSVWLNDSSPLQAIAKAQPAQANQNSLNPLPFEGANIVTVVNQVPFCTLTPATNALSILTSIVYDSSNVLAFNFTGTTNEGTYVMQGFIFGTKVSWVTQTFAGGTSTPPTLVVSNSGGLVKLDSVLQASTGVVNCSGMIRHI